MRGNILGNEDQALALLHEEMARPLNGDLCLRVSHVMRWHDRRQLPRARALLAEHCALLTPERAAAIRRIAAGPQPATGGDSVEVHRRIPAASPAARPISLAPAAQSADGGRAIGGVARCGRVSSA